MGRHDNVDAMPGQRLMIVSHRAVRRILRSLVADADSGAWPRRLADVGERLSA